MRWGPVLIIGVSAILIVILLWNNYSKEGFQNYTTLNVDYNKEVYSVGLPGTATNYTYDEAAEKCKSLGGTLATRAQLTTAQVIGAQWCKNGGWIADDKTNLYYPSQPADKNPACIGIATPGVQQVAPVGGKGYATCYGKKPDLGEFGVQYFSLNNPSVFDTDTLRMVISGNGKGPVDQNSSDLFTQEITPAQALFALEKGGPGGGPTGDWRVARQFIVDNWTTLNSQIRGTDPTPADNETLTNWTNAKTRSCQVLDGIQQDIVRKHQQLRNLYGYIRRLTSATQGAKTETMNFQREISYICSEKTATTSPACKRLAELDYAVLYTDPTGTGSLFKNLDNLNGMLAMRECELQTSLTALQKLMDSLKCDAAGFPFNKAALGDFKTADGKYYDCLNNDTRNITTTNCDPNTGICTTQIQKNPYVATFPGLMTAADSIGYIPSEDLKKALEEISPYFASPGYSDLFNTILNQLSILLRIPELNDYTTAKQNLYSTIPDRTDKIAAAVDRLWA